MNESQNEVIQDGLLAVADSLDKLAAIVANRTRECGVGQQQVVSVTPVSGWRALVGRAVNGEVRYDLVGVIAWVTKVRGIRGQAAVCQIPVVFDSETMRGISLEEYLHSTPGAVARILEPNQEGLSTSDTADFKAEILSRGRS